MSAPRARCGPRSFPLGPRALAGLCLLVTLAGCRATRATVGLGLGVGADVQVSGLLHTGALLWAGLEVGPCYGGSFGGVTAQGTFGLIHAVLAGCPCGSREHWCLGLLPGLVREAVRGRWHVWALEVGLALGIVKVDLGLDPTELPGLFAHE